MYICLYTQQNILYVHVYSFREHTISSLTETGCYHGAGAGRGNLLHRSYVKP